MDNPLDLTLVDESVCSVLAAWPHARADKPDRRVAKNVPDADLVCGWRFDRDRLARLSGVTTLQLERALEVMDVARLVDRDTGDVIEEARAVMRKALVARLRGR